MRHYEIDVKCKIWKTTNVKLSPNSLAETKEDLREALKDFLTIDEVLAGLSITIVDKGEIE